MGKEIERKYQVKGEEWRKLAEGTLYRQGYLSVAKERTVRVRTIGDKGYLTIKGLTKGISRMEFEYEVPHDDAAHLLDELCIPPLIEKKRYKIAIGDLVWEVDEFFGENDGLIIAEVELSDPDQKFDIPSWIGKEVSDDPRYFNANLTKHPFKEWSEK